MRLRHRDVHPDATPRSATAASLWWIFDSIAAALFAAALAISVQMLRSRNTDFTLVAAAGMAVAALLRAVLQQKAQTAGIIMAEEAKQCVRQSLFPKILQSRGPARRLLGEDISTAIDQVASLTAYYANFQPVRRAATVSPILVALLVAVVSPISAAILVATLVPFALGMALAGGAARRAADAQVLALSRLSGLFIDRIRSLPIILAFGAESRVTRQVDAAVHDVADRTYAVLRTAFLSSGTLEFFSAISVALVAVYCGFNLLGLLPFRVGEELDLPRAFFALALAPEFYLPLRRLSAAYHEKQLGEAALFAIQEREALVGPPIQRAQIGDDIEGLAVHDALIDYGGGRSVGPFSLDVRRGELIALTGPTGSGKTSLLHMIVGLAPLSSGALCVDEVRLVPGSLNGQIGWAGQHVIMLPGTIGENISLADPGAGLDAVDAVARRAGLTRLLEARREGLQSIIDSRGSGLSGGERRRIAIARALLADRPLLLLDEPTADLDSETAASIISLLRELAKTHAVLAATHDPALIAAATREVAIA